MQGIIVQNEGTFNNCDNNLSYKFSFCYCLPFIHSIMIHLSFLALELIIYDIIQLIKECFNELNDNFDGYKSEKENMDCVY